MKKIHFNKNIINNQNVVLAVFVLIVAFIGIHLLVGSHAASPYVSSEAESGVLGGGATTQTDGTASGGQSIQFGTGQSVQPIFNYGFDFSDNGPDAANQDSQDASNDPDSVTAALKVLSSFSGSMMDQSINGFGASANPEKNMVPVNTPLNSTNTDLHSIASRIKTITDAGGVPVITLVQAPEWMYDPQYCGDGLAGNINGALDDDYNTVGSDTFTLPPCPQNYPAFAKLCAFIAQSFPQVKYFVVWSEIRDFYNPTTTTYDAASYTTMYNDVYTAIKAARPDAQVGGPYAAMASFSSATKNSTAETLSSKTTWGYVSANMQSVLSYWLQNKVKADFIAMDGGTDIGNGYTGGGTLPTDPLDASLKYADVDTWLKQQPGFDNLPIWWMESHIQPTTGWTDAQAAAARIATVALMNASGATVGMQWQPNEQSSWPDEGLWTSVLTTDPPSTGGQATTLANELQPLLPMLQQRLTLVSDSNGVLVATEGNELLLVNTNNAPATASFNGASINLAPSQVSTETTP